MMQAVAVPPFERFYEEHRTDVLRLLRKRLGAERAEDAFQETFLRALRAYGRLDHAEHLRAWVLTIAHNVALDTLRRTRPTDELVETPSTDHRPAYAELAELTLEALDLLVAEVLERLLHAKGYQAFLLDGDNVRHGLSRDLGFTADITGLQSVQ
jgi:RNA polymerase sigma factor (sigma-70 family)